MTAKIKLNAASGGGSVALEAPTSTTSNANVEFKLPVADGTSGQALTTNASGQLAFATVSSAIQTTAGTDNFTIADGNLVIGTAGHGIDFSATSDSVRSGTATESSVLNDYEEGTWTPTGNGYTMSNTSGNCYYTKIGNVVHVIFRGTWPSLTSSTVAEISNLPYRVKNTSVSVAGGAFSEQNDANDLSMIAVANNFAMYILRDVPGGDGAQTISEVSGKDFRGTLTYFTDDN